jgi:hypothetical protein
MKIDKRNGQIKLSKELNDLDELVIDFVQLLDASKINYVLVSGYVSILFGRSRSSEVIHLIVEKVSKRSFDTLWGNIHKNFHCIVPDNAASAYENYLVRNTSLRFARKGMFIPNIELMFPKARGIDDWVLLNAKTVILNGKELRISPIELQVPYKLFLGSPKDIEDARHLYSLFKDSLDEDLLRDFLIKLDKHDLFNMYLK